MLVYPKIRIGGSTTSLLALRHLLHKSKYSVFLLDDETIEGMANTFRTLLSCPAEELRQMGVSAKNFVLKAKNSVIAASKLIELIK